MIIIHIYLLPQIKKKEENKEEESNVGTILVTQNYDSDIIRPLSPSFKLVEQVDWEDKIIWEDTDSTDNSASSTNKKRRD